MLAHQSVSSVEAEQWEARKHLYADSVDVHMPTSAAALANLLLEQTQKLGLGAGQTLNRMSRNAMYNAALAGHTQAVNTQGGWVQVGMNMDKLSIGLGFLSDDPDDEDPALGRPTASGDSAVRLRNMAMFCNLKYKLNAKTTLGLEAMGWETKWEEFDDGVGGVLKHDRHNLTTTMSLIYKF